MQEMQVWSLGCDDPLEEEMATDSSVSAGKFQWTEEHGELQFLESQRVRHDWETEQVHKHPIRYHLLTVNLHQDYCF